MPEHPRQTSPLKWLMAENMLLTICLKAALSKLPSEVGEEVARALNQSTGLDMTNPDAALIDTVAAELLGRLGHLAGVDHSDCKINAIPGRTRSL